MFSRLRQEWRLFIQARPGSRFVLLHERKRSGEPSLARRFFWWSSGVLLILVGLVMLVTPGPGLLSIAFGLGCLAQESLPVARKCDGLELRLRAAWHRWRTRRR